MFQTELNDTWGNHVGDLCYSSVSPKRAQTCLREGDTLARLGGDEVCGDTARIERSQAAKNDCASRCWTKHREGLSH